MKIQPPLKGVSDILADSQKTELTTRDMSNCRGTDPRTKKIRLSSRSGLTPYIDSTVNDEGSPVRALASVTYQRKNITYSDKASTSLAPLDLDDVTHSAQTSSALPVANADTDKQGNVYAVDGLAGIEKRNSLFELQWTLSLPVRQETATVRALRVASMVGLVDADSEVVFAGVSQGGRQKDALLWGYKQISTRDEDGKVETKTEKLFEIETNAYTEVIRIRNGLLYAAQNEPDKGQAWVRVYFGLTTPGPDIAFEFEVPYPVNGMDVRDKDGAIITCHPQNLNRGKDPRNTIYTARDLAQEWKITDLTDYDKRIWSDFNAATIGDELGLKDGDTVNLWPDGSPNLRALTQVNLAEQPIYVELGIGGRPAIRFQGATAALDSNLESGFNPSSQAQFDDQQKTIIPAFSKCRWVQFWVIRLPSEAAVRPIFFQDNENPGGSDPHCDSLLANKTTALGAAGDSNTGPFSGKIGWFSMCDSTTGLAAGKQVSGGPRTLPFSADYAYAGGGGTCILTIVHDGHANSATDVAQHSTLRVNGRPVDRWVSANQEGLTRSYVGAGAFAAFLQGDVSRILTFREYTDGGVHGDPISGAMATTGLSHYPRTVNATLAGSAGRNFGANSTNRYNDNEIERIEGVLAGEYGISHLLPCGTASRLTISTIPSDGDTVTIDSTTYTFKTAITASANSVLIGATALTAATNLYQAINQTGVAGTQYSDATSAHVSCRATCLNDQDNAAGASGIIKIETNGETAVVVTESTGGVRMAWYNDTNTGTGSPTGALLSVVSPITSYMPGHYPHPFSLSYGYPRKDKLTTVGVTLESKGKLLTSEEGILARWDANGKIAWVATSRDSVTYGSAITLPAADEHYGGIGFDCAFGTDEDVDAIYSIGQTYLTSPTTDEEFAVVRRMIDNTTSVDLTGAGTWSMTIGDLTNAASNQISMPLHTRIAVDTFDNVYLPYLDTTPNNDYDGSGYDVMSLMCIETIDVAGTLTPNVAWYWRPSNTSTTPAGMCVAIDKKLPDYDGDAATRAFAVVVGTTMGYVTDDLTQDNLYRIEPVTVVHATGVPPSETRLCAVVNGEFWTSLNGAAFEEPSGVVTDTTIANPVFATDTDNPEGFISLVALNGHLFGTDGLTYIDYDGRKDTVKAMQSKTAGELKARARGVAAYRGRLIWYRFPDSPHEYLMSAVGNPYDYDISPPVQSATQAVLGSKSPRGTGAAPDIVNTLIPFGDDTLIFGCNSSIFRLDGDPMDNGRFTLMSDSTGIAFGDSWCKDENGSAYIFGTRGVVYLLSPEGLQPISEVAIPERLRSIDFATTRPKMLWNNEEQGFHLFMCPVDPANAEVVEHYFWSRKLQGWYPDSFTLATMQPTATFVGDGDLAENRRAVIGCADGYVRAFDSSVTDDDGEIILSHALIGPLTADEEQLETHFKNLQAVMARSQGGIGYQLFASDTPDDLGSPVASGDLDPGRNGTHYVQAVGSYVALKISNSTLDGWSIESIQIDAYPAGAKQPR